MTPEQLDDWQAWDKLKYSMESPEITEWDDPATIKMKNDAKARAALPRGR